MIKYLLFFLIPVTANAFDLFQLEQVAIDYKAFSSGGHNQLIQDSGLPPREADKYVSITMDTTIFNYFFFNNIVHGTTDQPVNGNGQFRAIGWNYKLGVYLTDFMTVQYEHHSQHLLDFQGINHFPVEDSLGFTIKLYQSKQEHGRIW
jgi:hypothetical protein